MITAIVLYNLPDTIGLEECRAHFTSIAPEPKDRGDASIPKLTDDAVAMVSLDGSVFRLERQRHRSVERAVAPLLDMPVPFFLRAKALSYPARQIAINACEEGPGRQFRGSTPAGCHSYTVPHRPPQNAA